MNLYAMRRNQGRIRYLSAPQCPALVVLGIGFCLLLCEQALWHANDLGRQCITPTMNLSLPDKPLKIGMISLSDDAESIEGRSFSGIMSMVLPNKLSYARKHGYEFIDASHLLDTSRPPSWTKIKALQFYLPHFHWLFWNDADSLVTNVNVTLESIIYSLIGNPDLKDIPNIILTEDVTGVNAGMFFVRNTDWSKEFLSLWWNQAEFIRPFGQTKSGDNDALKYLIRNMSMDDLKHNMCIVKMQCSFNSYAWNPSWKNIVRFITKTGTVWRGTYSRGDFMVHLAGLDDKKAWIKKFLGKSEANSQT